MTDALTLSKLKVDAFPTIKKSSYEGTYLVLGLLLFTSIYGILSIFVENMMVRSIKDVLVFAFAIISFSSIKGLSKKYCTALLLIIAAILIVGSIGLIQELSLVTWLYGFKVSILPMTMIFVGLNYYNENSRKHFEFTFLIIYILLLSAWLIQYKLGIAGLMRLGFVYGVNIRNFEGGLARLPSLTFSPDNYAYFLAVVGVFLGNCQLAIRSKPLQWGFKILTFIFLILSTIRSAIILWIVSQIVMFFLQIRRYSNKNLLRLGLVFVIGPILVFAVYLFLQNQNLLSANSIGARVQQWGSIVTSPYSLQGMIGLGLGAVGAASRRTDDLGLQSHNYSVDNQYLALYEQFGWVGIIFFAILIFFLTKWLKDVSGKKGYKNNASVHTAFSLICGTLFAGFTTNALELFPFNIFLWFIVGASLNTEHSVITEEENES